MDPALQEQLLPDLDPEGEVEAIVRLKAAGKVPTQIKVISTFGDIITCRVKRRSIRDAYQAPELVSMKAARYYEGNPLIPSESGESPLENGERRFKLTGDPVDFPTGKKVVLAALDWGADFAHPNFLDAKGKSRFLAVWDQATQTDRGSGLPYGYGKLYTKTAIDEALASPEPYLALGYHPAKGDPLGTGAHGTHVLDIAGGRGAIGFRGIAPDADLLFVHLSAKNIGGRFNLGDSVRLLEAIDFARRVAEDRPLVINLSAGRHGGPHDGQTLVELGMDNLLAARPNTMICQSAGNYFQSRTHHAHVIRPGSTSSFTFFVDDADKTPNELEIWYSGKDEVTMTLENEATGKRFSSRLGENRKISHQGELVGRIYHRRNDPNNGKNHIDVFLYNNAPTGYWRTTLHGTNITDGRYHAWLERDRSGVFQTRFTEATSDHKFTTGTICNGYNSIVVGAYDDRQSTFTLAPFSSQGPTVDGRLKPDLVAPGVMIQAARSTPRHLAQPTRTLTRMSGTSMAAPHVSGTAAILLELLPPNTPFHLIRSLIISSADPVEANGNAMRVGNGKLNVAGAVKNSLQLVKPPDFDAEKTAIVQGQNKIGSMKEEPVFVHPEYPQYNRLIEIECTEDALNRPMECGEEAPATILEAEDNEAPITAPVAPKEEDYLEEDEMKMAEHDFEKIAYGEDYRHAEDGESDLAGNTFFDDVIACFTGNHLEAGQDLLDYVQKNYSTEAVYDKYNLPFSDAADLFDSLAHTPETAFNLYPFEVIAWPGQKLWQALKPGDILLRRMYGEGRPVWQSMLTDGALIRVHQGENHPGLSEREQNVPGNYGYVVEVYPHQKGIERYFLRLITDEDARMPMDQAIVRVTDEDQPEGVSAYEFKASCAIPPFTITVQQKIGPLLSAQKLKCAICANRIIFPSLKKARKNAPITNALKCVNINCQILKPGRLKTAKIPEDLVFSKLTNYVDPINLDGDFLAQHGRYPEYEEFFAEMAHQFQQKCLSDPRYHDGIVGKSTLADLGFIRHGLGAASWPNLKAKSKLKALRIMYKQYSHKNWYDYIVDASFLGEKEGQPGETNPSKRRKNSQGFHVILVEKLRKAERYLRKLRQYQGLSPVEIGKKLGIKDPHEGYRPMGSVKSMHSYGIALDINYWGNPYIGRKDNGPYSPKKRNLPFSILKKATAAANDPLPSNINRFPAYLFSLARYGNYTSGQIWDEVNKRNEQFKKYVKNNPKVIGGLKGITTGNFVYNRDPRKGFIDHQRDLIIALRDKACLAWGGIDWGYGSGDMMHFDCGTEKVFINLAASVSQYMVQSKHPCGILNTHTLYRTAGTADPTRQLIPVSKEENGNSNPLPEYNVSDILGLPCFYVPPPNSSVGWSGIRHLDCKKMPVSTTKMPASSIYDGGRHKIGKMHRFPIELDLINEHSRIKEKVRFIVYVHENYCSSDNAKAEVMFFFHGHFKDRGGYHYHKNSLLDIHTYLIPFQLQESKRKQLISILPQSTCYSKKSKKYLWGSSRGTPVYNLEECLKKVFLKLKLGKTSSGRIKHVILAGHSGGSFGVRNAVRKFDKNFKNTGIPLAAVALFDGHEKAPGMLRINHRIKLNPGFKLFYVCSSSPTYQSIKRNYFSRLIRPATRKNIIIENYYAFDHTCIVGGNPPYTLPTGTPPGTFSCSQRKCSPSGKILPTPLGAALIWQCPPNKDKVEIRVFPNYGRSTGDLDKQLGGAYNTVYKKDDLAPPSNPLKDLLRRLPAI